jgi:hypothetical protein
MNVEVDKLGIFAGHFGSDWRSAKEMQVEAANPEFPRTRLVVPIRCERHGGQTGKGATCPDKSKQPVFASTALGPLLASEFFSFPFDRITGKKGAQVVRLMAGALKQ